MRQFAPYERPGSHLRPRPRHPSRMRVNRVYVDAPLRPGSLIELPPAAAQHLAKVLRARSGDEIVLFGGDGFEFTAAVESVRGSRVTAAVGEGRAIDRESPLA